MSNITVADNSAQLEVSQLAWDDTNTILTNSIVKIHIDYYGNPSINVTYSNIEDDLIGGDGVFNGDPYFLISNGNYSLQEDSPCIDSGDPNSPLDPDGTIADMGACYYHQEFIIVMKAI